LIGIISFIFLVLILTFGKKEITLSHPTIIALIITFITNFFFSYIGYLNKDLNEKIEKKTKINSKQKKLDYFEQIETDRK